MKRPYYFILAGLLSLAGCAGDPMKTSEPIKPLTPLETERLSSLRFFFGHQSVGLNVIEGIETLGKENPGLKLSVVQGPSVLSYEAPVFGHAEIGKNLDPELKFADFSGKLDSGIGEKADMAFMKLCYVDFDVTTDAQALFASYQKSVDTIMARHPNLLLVHFTAPLTAYPAGLKSRISRLIGRTVPEDVRNLHRNRYNALMRESYGAGGRLFDLAAIESDGVQGATGQTLSPEFTSDGGHLNSAGSRRVAGELLHFLAIVK